MEELERIVNFLFEVGTARNILRTHHQVLRNADDSVADHSFGVAVIGLVLAELEKVDKDKVFQMCFFHDFPEIRTGDPNFINSFYRADKEEKAIEDQWAGIPGGEGIVNLLTEYNERKTREAIVAKDADVLGQIFLQREYLPAGSYDLERWHNHQAARLKTDSARKLADLVLKTNPLKWLYDFSDSQKTKKPKDV